MPDSMRCTATVVYHKVYIRPICFQKTQSKLSWSTRQFLSAHVIIYIVKKNNEVACSGGLLVGRLYKFTFGREKFAQKVS